MKALSALSMAVLCLSLAGCAAAPASQNNSNGTNPVSVANSGSVNTAWTNSSTSNDQSGAVNASTNSASTNSSNTSAPSNPSNSNSTGSSGGAADAGPKPATSPSDTVVITAKHLQTQQLNITYAQLSGLANQSAEEKLNEDLRVDASRLQLMNKDDTYTSTYRVLFQAGPLLEIDYDGYDYPQGAAHGQPTQRIFLMNLATGSLYTMKDLFLPQSNYLSTLSKLVRQKDTKHVLSPQFTGVTASDGFLVTNTGIEVFFDPYEWASFANGFPTYDISFSELGSIINTNGELWKALGRSDTKQDVSLQTADIAKIKALGYTPSPNNGYSSLAPQFAQSPSPDGVLYAFGATKGTQGLGKVFFFDNSKYLGTDTLTNHGAVTNLSPNGPSSITARYDYDAGGTWKQLDIQFTWDGHALTPNPGFPQNFQ